MHLSHLQVMKKKNPKTHKCAQGWLMVNFIFSLIKHWILPTNWFLFGSVFFHCLLCKQKHLIIFCSSWSPSQVLTCSIILMLISLRLNSLWQRSNYCTFYVQKEGKLSFQMLKLCWVTLSSRNRAGMLIQGKKFWTQNSKVYFYSFRSCCWVNVGVLTNCI